MQRGGSRGGARGARPPHPALFFDQIEARRAKKKILLETALPLSQGLDDRVPPVISGSG